jgi:hypothetical protein
MGYDSTIKKNEIMSLAEKWMELEIAKQNKPDSERQVSFFCLSYVEFRLKEKNNRCIKRGLFWGENQWDRGR